MKPKIIIHLQEGAPKEEFLQLLHHLDFVEKAVIIQPDYQDTMGDANSNVSIPAELQSHYYSQKVAYT